MKVKTLIKFLQKHKDKHVLLRTRQEGKCETILLAQSVRSCNPWYICITSRLAKKVK